MLVKQENQKAIFKSTTMFVILLLSIFLCSTSQIMAGVLEIKGQIFDFGYVPFLTEAKHRAYLINNTDHLIKITAVRTGCGCTQIPLKSKEIPVGDTLEVELILNMSQIAKGRFLKTPKIMTDDPMHPTVEMTLKGINYDSGDVPGPFRMRPGFVKFTSSTTDGEGKIEIRNVSPQSVITKLIEHHGKSLYDVVLPSKPLMSRAIDTITVRIRKDSKEKEFKDSFTFSLSDLQQTRFTVPVSSSP
jgi:hypothetical protein